jgi:hypothetical protein
MLDKRIIWLYNKLKEKKMSTSEENKELVETLKGPRYYQISLWGYGGEVGYLSLNKEQYEYWETLQKDDNGEVVNYMLDPEDTETEIDPQMDFLADDVDPTYHHMWYDAENLVVHQNGVDYSHARITVEELANGEYGSSIVKTIVEGEDLTELVDKHELDVEMGVDETQEPQYVMQVYNSEKGTFFDGIIETVGSFDPKKLKFYTTEYWNGDDTVESIEYDGVDIDNNGGDTNGKGTSVYFWKN